MGIAGIHAVPQLTDHGACHIVIVRIVRLEQPVGHGEGIPLGLALPGISQVYAEILVVLRNIAGVFSVPFSFGVQHDQALPLAQALPLKGKAAALALAFPGSSDHGDVGFPVIGVFFAVFIE
jgi:hypothetical protein